MEKSTLILQWDHVKCYHFYELLVVTEDNSTVFLNETVEISSENDVVSHEIEKFQPCTGT